MSLYIYLLRFLKVHIEVFSTRMWNLLRRIWSILINSIGESFLQIIDQFIINSFCMLKFIWFVYLLFKLHALQVDRRKINWFFNTFIIIINISRWTLASIWSDVLLCIDLLWFWYNLRYVGNQVSIHTVALKILFSTLNKTFHRSSTIWGIFLQHHLDHILSCSF